MKFTVAITYDVPWCVARCLDVDVVNQGEIVFEEAAGLEDVGLCSGQVVLRDVRLKVAGSDLACAPLTRQRLLRCPLEECG